MFECRDCGFSGEFVVLSLSFKSLFLFFNIVMFLKRSFQLLVCSATSEEDLDLKSILSHLKKMCLENPDNKINDPGMCSSSLDSMNYPTAG